MANWSDPRAGAAPFATRAGVRDAAYDAGLRSYMLSVYNYMASGVMLSGIVALGFVLSGMAESLLLGGGILRWVIALAPLGFVMAMSFGLNRMTESTLKMLYWAFAFVMGLSLSSIFLVYSPLAIAQAFFATSAGFAALSLYGYTTKRDLAPLGTFLIMGVVGLVVAMLINSFFVQSSGFGLAISLVGVLLFAGLTAYDTQRIKSMYAHVAGTDMMGKTVVMGALSLYLDFINMFMFILRLMGGNRD